MSDHFIKEMARMKQEWEDKYEEQERRHKEREQHLKS